MTPESPATDPIERFNRRLDALQHGRDPQAVELDAGLSDSDREALELARRLANLNPSLESRSRYSLRRHLLTQARTGARRPGPAAWLLRSLSTSAAIRLPGLSLALAGMFVLVWTLVSFQFVAVGAPPAGDLPVDGIAAPRASQTSMRMISAQPAELALSPQPLRTPRVPAQVNTDSPTPQVPMLTPALAPRNAMSSGQPDSRPPSVIP